MIAKVSQREAEVLAAVAARLSNAQIANRLRISVRTVESHVASLLRKYGAADRQELAQQAVQAGVDRDIPEGPRPGVPTPMTSFVGREREHEAALAAFGASRLVTLLGPGGAGKSRLAAEICSSYPAGGAFVDLVPVRDGFVAQAAAKVLRVSERAQQPLEDAVIERLRRDRALLVLDSGRVHADPDALAASVARWEGIDARLERAHTLLLIPHRAEEGRAALAALLTSTGRRTL
ncbi:LuxR C-terminal-related transcriptional regulator [Nonomuraea sp. NPDC049655]|uniref:response regulator transcription factor n=1 Tax=Nonomuraea sp. NPDC049655 TaxID=3364355 RepID=UPI0037A19D27